MENCCCKFCGFDYTDQTNDSKDVILEPLFLDINGIYYPDTKSIIRNYEADFLNKYKIIEAVFNNGEFKSTQEFFINISNDPDKPWNLPIRFSLVAHLRHSPFIVCEVYCNDCFKKKNNKTTDQ